MAGIIIPFFVVFCFAIYWTLFVRFIFFVFNIYKPVLQAWISFIPVFIHMFFTIVLSFEIAIHWFKSQVLLRKEAYSYLTEFFSEIFIFWTR